MSDTFIDDILARSKATFEMESASDRNRCSVAALMYNDGQVVRSERDYIRHVDDLMQIAGAGEKGLLHGHFDDIAKKMTDPLSKVTYPENLPINIICLLTLQKVPLPDFPRKEQDGFQVCQPLLGLAS